MAPVFPVPEESDDVLDNVFKQNIDITAFNVSDVKKLGVIVPDPTFDVSENEPIVVRSVFHNNGPFGPTDVSDDITAASLLTARASWPRTNPTPVTPARQRYGDAGPDLHDALHAAQQPPVLLDGQHRGQHAAREGPEPQQQLGLPVHHQHGCHDGRRQADGDERQRSRQRPG